jgi:hydrogenase-4 component E
MIDFFIGLFLANLIVSLFTTRLHMLILWYALNSLSLGIAALLIGQNLQDNPMILTGVVTIILKGFALPYILKYLSKKFDLKRQIAPNIKIPYTIILVPAVIVFTFYLSEPIIGGIGSHQNYVAISIAAMFLSLILMLEHKNIAPKIIGFLSMENALFLLGISATDGMPMLVELGIFFDLLMAIVVINLLFRKEEIQNV